MKWYKAVYIVVDRGNNRPDEDITIFYTHNKKKYQELLNNLSWGNHYENIILNIDDAFHFVWKYGRDLPNRRVLCKYI